MCKNVAYALLFQNSMTVCAQVHFFSSVQFSSVAQSCPTLCDPMNHSTPTPCPSPTPRIHLNSHPLSPWCLGEYAMGHKEDRAKEHDCKSLKTSLWEKWFKILWTGGQSNHILKKDLNSTLGSYDSIWILCLVISISCLCSFSSSHYYTQFHPLFPTLLLLME